MLIRHATLWPWHLTRWPWKFMVHQSSRTWSKSIRNLSEIEQSPVELLIILRIIAHVMSRCDLHLWFLDFDLYRPPGVMCILCVKFERNRILDGWGIDDLARFAMQFFGVAHFCPIVLRSAWTQLYQTWLRHRAIIRTQEICFRGRISCCIFKRGRLKVEWCWKRR